MVRTAGPRRRAIGLLMSIGLPMTVACGHREARVDEISSGPAQPPPTFPASPSTCSIVLEEPAEVGPYPLPVQRLNDAERRALESEFRRETGLPWATVEISPFGTLRMAWLRETPTFSDAERLPVGDSPAYPRLHRHWRSFVDTHAALLGLRHPPILDACAPDTQCQVRSWFLGQTVEVRFHPKRFGQTSSIIVTGMALPPPIGKLPPARPDGELTQAWLGLPAIVTITQRVENTGRDRPRVIDAAEVRVALRAEHLQLRHDVRLMFEDDGEAALRRTVTPHMAAAKSDIPRHLLALRGELDARMTLAPEISAPTLVDAVTAEDLSTACRSASAVAAFAGLPIRTCSP